MQTFELKCNHQYFMILQCNELCYVFQMISPKFYIILQILIMVKIHISSRTMMDYLMSDGGKKKTSLHVCNFPSRFLFSPPLWLTHCFSHHRTNRSCGCRRSRRSSRRPTHTTLTRPSSTTRSMRRSSTWRRL